jgi:competence protein CoiA
MLKALVGGEETHATPGAKGSCPGCQSPVIAKCGSKIVWHWAHESLDDCDSWSEGETIWHAAWKSRFQNTEVVIERHGQKHRADAVSRHGAVIEFQHSAISPGDVADREEFYRNMVWVLDGGEAFHHGRIGLQTVSPGVGREYVKFRWKSRRRSFDDTVCPLFIDLGFAFSDYGKIFHKPIEWWDDDEGGLRDGIRRPGGMNWQRASHDLLLLEVKKRSDGYGWGRLISHQEFCSRLGGDGYVPYRTARSVRWVPGYGNWDGYAYRGDCGMDQSKDMPLVFYGKSTDWCENQLQATRRYKEDA